MRTATIALLCAAGLSSAAITTDAHAKSFTVDSITTESSNGDLNDIYFPVVCAEDHADEFPMIVLLPGGKVDKSQYSGYAQQLAKRGYVIAIANHWRPLGPPGTPPDRFASLNGMVASMQLLQQLDADPESPLYQIIDEDTLGVQGHSFGGGAGLWAVEGTCGPFDFFCDSMGPAGPVPYFKPAELKAAVLWATSSYMRTGAPDPVLLDPETSAHPVVIFSGGNDQGSPVEDALDTYELLDGTRAVLEFEGMTHWGICNEEDPAGNTPDPGEPEVDQEKGQRRIAKWADRFFKAHLYGDKGMLKKIYDKQKGDKHVVIVAAEL